MTKAIYTILFSGVCCSCIGSGSNDSSAGEAFTKQGEDLVITTGRLWALGDFPLTVCFQSTGDGSTSERAAVRSAVEGTWGAIPGTNISFTGWGTCANDSTSGDIRVFLDSFVERSSSRYGTDNHASGHGMVLRTPESTYNTHLTYAYVHEFGHALGIQHEQAHPDSTCADDETLISGAVAATPYDPDAVMNYCASFPETLSPYEELFGKMVYPDGSSLPLACQEGCFGGTTKANVRSDGWLWDSFTAQGAYPWWSSGTGALGWKRNGTAAATGSSLTAATLGAGSWNVTYAGTVTYTGVAVSGAGSVLVDDGAWTGIATTFL